MKIQLLYFYILALLLIDCKVSVAQKDSTRASNTKEYLDSTNYKFNLKYHYLDIKLKNEKILLKFGLSSSLFDEKFLAVNIGIEKKASPSESLFPFVKLYRYIEDSVSNIRFRWLEITAASLNLEYRFYYGMNEKVKNNVIGNHVFGNYIMLGVNDFVGYYNLNESVSYNQGGYSKYEENVRTKINWNLNLTGGWGLQRRIGNIGYFDGTIKIGITEVIRKLGLKINDNGFYPQRLVDIRLTLGFGFNLRRRK